MSGANTTSGAAEGLERRLAAAALQAARSPHKKQPPPPPPKKPAASRAQPQVPRSATLALPREPSYAARLPAPPAPPPPHNHNPLYSNIPQNFTVQNATYRDLAPQHEPAPYNIHSHVYSNVPPYEADVDSLPPPPLSAYPKSYLDVNRNPEELLPPPSPVSSNYSELARATDSNYHPMQQDYPHYQNGYVDFGGSQASNYESIYEPIDQRPRSALSSHSDSSMYRPYRNGAGNRQPLPKEAEVDVLTDLLVKSIGDSQESDIYGVCIRCHVKVMGETSGCTAMGQIYHVQCFRCPRCGDNLQGKPFYAVEGQPYCEKDYLETLEKCSVCDKPILDRILRATGKPYHPACFVCVVCGKSLDGIPFTVDATNQIHCIDDFHKKFAPRCCVCTLPIMPEPGQEETVRVVALDRSFHVKCYRCEDCGLHLSSEAEGRGCYPLDGHILCKGCNAHRVRQLTNVMTTDL